MFFSLSFYEGVFGWRFTLSFSLSNSLSVVASFFFFVLLFSCVLSSVLENELNGHQHDQEETKTHKKCFCFANVGIFSQLLLLSLIKRNDLNNNLNNTLFARWWCCA